MYLYIGFNNAEEFFKFILWFFSIDCNNMYFCAYLSVPQCIVFPVQTQNCKLRNCKSSITNQESQIRNRNIVLQIEIKEGGWLELELGSGGGGGGFQGRESLIYLRNLSSNLTVPISLAQHFLLYGKSYFWPKFFIQPPGTQ
jgi:hypothetical protein